MGISGFFGQANISKIRLHVEFPQEIFAETPFPVKVVLHNDRMFPAFLVRVEFPATPLLFPFIDKHSADERYAMISLKLRGRNQINDIRISSVFPFNFFTRFNRKTDHFDVTAFPKLIKCDLIDFNNGTQRSKGDMSSGAAGYESDMISIRQYVLGDPIKYINWKATAKTGELKTKELSALVFQPVIIDFDRIGGRDIEERISFTAYILLQFLRQQIPVGLKLKDTIMMPAITRQHRIEMLTSLALYSPEK